MTYLEALKKIRKTKADSFVREIDTKRQRKKFAKGWGIVRQLAGLPHGRAVCGR